MLGDRTNAEFTSESNPSAEEKLAKLREEPASCQDCVKSLIELMTEGKSIVLTRWVEWRISERLPVHNEGLS